MHNAVKFGTHFKNLETSSMEGGFCSVAAPLVAFDPLWITFSQPLLITNNNA